jgi:transcriptional regulator with XRE-family HTH domain
LYARNLGAFVLSASEQPDRELIVLGEAIRQLREQHRIASSELAAVAGIEREHLDALEAGRLDPPYDLLLALAEGLGVPIEVLVIRAKDLRDKGS